MLRLVEYNEQYLHESLKWLNDPEIRLLTDTQSIVTPESQQTWFNGLSDNPTYKIWGIECDSMPIGACGIKHISSHTHTHTRRGEYWGYIGEKAYWGGKGHDLMHLVFDKAKELKIDELYLFVLRINPRAKQLYLSEGFEIEREEEREIWMRKFINAD